jgi:hypothetical protein
MPLDDTIEKNLVSLTQNFNQKTPYLDSCTKKTLCHFGKVDFNMYIVTGWSLLTSFFY